MKEFVIVFTLLFVLFTCSNLSTLSETNRDSDLFVVCEQICKQHYSDTYGVKEHRRLKNDVVCCECMRPRGDKKIYVNIEQFESANDTIVDVETLKP